MASPVSISPILCFGSSEPRDLLANAASVCTFLGETAGQFSEDASGGGLSEDGATGLAMILDTVVETINHALEAI